MYRQLSEALQCSIVAKKHNFSYYGDGIRLPCPGGFPCIPGQPGRARGRAAVNSLPTTVHWSREPVKMVTTPAP